MKKIILALFVLAFSNAMQAQVSSKMKMKSFANKPVNAIPAKLANCGQYYASAIKEAYNSTEVDDNIIVNTCNSWTEKRSADGGSHLKKSWVVWNKYAISISFTFKSGYKLEDGKYKFLERNLTLKPNECIDFLTVEYIGYENLTNDKNYYFITNFKGIL